jgi:hypothetical protein
MQVIVYLESGVLVEIPEGTDTTTIEGYRATKEAAREKLIDILHRDFDVQIEGGEFS